MYETKHLNLHPDTLRYELYAWCEEHEREELCCSAKTVLMLLDYGLNKRGLSLNEPHKALGAGRMSDLSGFPFDPLDGVICPKERLAQIDLAAQGHYQQGELL